MGNRYICTKDLYIGKYDDDRFFTDKYFRVPKDSIWESDSDTPRYLGCPTNIRLVRVWKTKHTKTEQWIEICRDTFEEHFKLMN